MIKEFVEDDYICDFNILVKVMCFFLSLNDNIIKINGFYYYYYLCMFYKLIYLY